MVIPLLVWMVLTRPLRSKFARVPLLVSTLVFFPAALKLWVLPFAPGFETTAAPRAEDFAAPVVPGLPPGVALPLVPAVVLVFAPVAEFVFVPAAVFVLLPTVVLVLAPAAVLVLAPVVVVVFAPAAVVVFAPVGVPVLAPAVAGDLAAVAEPPAGCVAGAVLAGAAGFAAGAGLGGGADFAGFCWPAAIAGKLKNKTTVKSRRILRSNTWVQVISILLGKVLKSHIKPELTLMIGKVSIETRRSLEGRCCSVTWRSFINDQEDALKASKPGASGQLSCVCYYALRKSSRKTVIEGEKLSMESRNLSWPIMISAEDRMELDLLFSATYEELRRLASLPMAPASKARPAAAGRPRLAAAYRTFSTFSMHSPEVLCLRRVRA